MPSVRWRLLPVLAVTVLGGALTLIVPPRPSVRSPQCVALALPLRPSASAHAAVQRGVRAARAAPRAALLEDMQLLTQKTLDTVEDATLHLRRLSAYRAARSPDSLAEDSLATDPRPHVVVLGFGWAAHAFVKVVDASANRVTVVSPRNHFLFTPMLAATAVGTVEYRSIIESVRASNPLVDFIEGAAEDVDPVVQTVDVRLNPLLEWPVGAGNDPHLALGNTRDAAKAAAGGGEASGLDGSLRTLRLHYDTLVVACGSRVTVDAVPGAAQRCHRLKEVEDARSLRRAVSEAFERAARPGVPAEERKRLLAFVVVGGGPTGVELAGELTDLLRADAKILYPALVKYAQVIIVHGGNSLLPPFDAKLRTAAREGLEGRGVRCIMRARVFSVGDRSLTVNLRHPEDQPGSAQESFELPYGVCVWCAGTKPQAFVSALLDKLPPEARAADNRIAVDPWLRVPTGCASEYDDDGASGPAVGPPRLGSILTLGDAASETFVADDLLPLPPGQTQGGGDEDTSDAASGSPVMSVPDTPPSSPLPQTAQVAAQQGAFAARLINRRYDLSLPRPRLPDPDSAALSRTAAKAKHVEALNADHGNGREGGATGEASPTPAAAAGSGALLAPSPLVRLWLEARGAAEAPQFKFLNLGILAYLGGGEALSQLQLGDLTLLREAGSVGFLLWRSVYIVKQVATKNRVLVTFDWFKSWAFGRDMTRF